MANGGLSEVLTFVLGPDVKPDLKAKRTYQAEVASSRLWGRRSVCLERTSCEVGQLDEIKV